jgi:hypothetical protein
VLEDFGRLAALSVTICCSASPTGQLACGMLRGFSSIGACCTGSDVANPVQKILEETLLRRGARGVVEDSARSGHCRIRWQPAEQTLSSLIVCSRSPLLLKQFLYALESRTASPEREVVVVHHCGHDDDVLKAVIEKCAARCVPYSGPFHFSRMNNLGAEVATGQIVVFLNDDVEPLDPS